MLGHACLHLVLASLIAAPPDAAGQAGSGSDERTAWFREAKFGLFIHWGAYSVIGRHEWARDRLQIHQSQYDEYVRKFNPVKYNPDEWVRLADEAGMRYIVITSKHHDGFSIYRSAVSDYDMELTPYPGDPLKMLADECERRGMRLGFYHSIMDWHHPDYVPRRRWETDRSTEGADFDRYIDFMKEQLRELLTGYGDVAVIWFDGEWEHTTTEMRSDEVRDFILSIQPNCLINDRLYKREPGNPADFGTPEQYVPATGITDPSGKPVLWEACVTINNDSWGYNKYETVFKTERDLIRMLIEIVSKGGNLLLNVGPKLDGTIQDEFVSRLRAMGRWMDTNGDAIYGTTASCFRTLPFFGRCTVKGDRVFLHVFQWPADARLRVPGLRNDVRSARLLAEPSAKLKTAREGDSVIVELPPEAPDEIASVVELVLDGEPDVADSPLRPGEDGVLILPAAAAEIESTFGQRAKFENALGHVFITNWTRAKDVPAWRVDMPSRRRYGVTVSCGTHGGDDPADMTISIGEVEVTAPATDTGGGWVFKTLDLGEIEIPAGEQTVRANIRPGAHGETVNLESVTFMPVQ